MTVRKLHRIVALVFSPFFLITAVTGIALLWRKAGIYDKDTKGFLLGVHNWEIASKYIGVILAVGLILVTVTGLIMFIKSARRN